MFSSSDKADFHLKLSLLNEKRSDSGEQRPKVKNHFRLKTTLWN